MKDIGHFSHPAARPKKTKRRTARHSSPQTPPAVPSDSIFFEIATEKKKAERSESAFHSRKNHTCGFSTKKVRTSSKNRRKKVKSVSVGEIAPSQTTDGGRGGIPPQTPPSAPPASLLDFFGIFVTNAKGARGEKTRARSRTRGFSPAVTKFIAKTNHNHRIGSKRPTSAS